MLIKIKFLANFITLANYINELKSMLRIIRIIENIDMIIFFIFNLFFMFIIFLISSFFSDNFLSLMIMLFLSFLYLYIMTPFIVKKFKTKHLIKSWIKINMELLNLGLKPLNIDINNINKNFYNKELKEFLNSLNKLLNDLSDDILIYINKNSDILKEKTESMKYSISEIKRLLNINFKQIENISEELDEISENEINQ